MTLLLLLHPMEIKLFLSQTYLYGPLASRALTLLNARRYAFLRQKKNKILLANLNKSSSQRHLWKLFLLLQNFVSRHQAQSSDVTESEEWWADCVMTEGMESKERWRRQVWHAVWQSAAVLSPFSLLLSVCLQRLFLSIFTTSASSVSIFSLTFAFA